ncbi:Exonuclease [Artemisia annua]|uniref:Exonuclease n=1 Tax=Artemisia annua TaxID=35608 RepID=A0A2U1NME1_ARTAN|nr:Exonuclease [Artemisia annua]
MDKLKSSILRGLRRCKMQFKGGSPELQMAGISWLGRAHCGLDDAKNTARLLAAMMHKGFRFSITSSIMCHSADHLAFAWKPPPGHIPFPPYIHHFPHKPKDLHFFPIFHPCCFCGVKSSKGMIRKPGPKQGSCFFGCGNWTSARGSRCQFFEWA